MYNIHIISFSLKTNYTSNYIMNDTHNIIIYITKAKFATKSKDC